MEEINGLRKVKDSAKMRRALDRLVELHEATSSKSVRHDLQHVAGQVLADKETGTDRIAAAEALGRLNDTSGAYKHLKRSLPGPKTEAAGPAELAALRAVGKLAPDVAIPALVQLMTKGKDNSASKEAVIALGAFGSSKKRVRVLEEIFSYMQRSKPRYAPGKRVGVATRARWNALGRAMVSALNRLTGQKLPDADEWIDLYKTLKKRPKKLFLDDQD